DLRPVLGVSLSEDLEYADAFPIKNALDMLHALFMTMQRAHDTRYISKSKEENIIFIPVKKIGATDLTISKEKQASLIDLGVEHTKAFLKNWPYKNRNTTCMPGHFSLYHSHLLYHQLLLYAVCLFSFFLCYR